MKYFCATLLSSFDDEPTTLMQVRWIKAESLKTAKDKAKELFDLSLSHPLEKRWVQVLKKDKAIKRPYFPSLPL